MLNPLFLTLLLIGGWIIYEDLRKGKIKNYSLIILVLVGVFLNFYYSKAFIQQPLSSAINIFFAILVGLIIWWAGFWPAADAKLFISLVILFPVTFFKPSSGYFPALPILVNSTAPLFFFLILQTLIKTSLRDKMGAVKKILMFSLLGRIFLMVTAIVLLGRLVSFFFQIRLEHFLWLLLILGLFWLFEEKLKIRLTYLFISIIIFTLIFFPQSISSEFFSLVFILVLLILSALFIINLSTPLFSQKVKINELKEGMILTEMVLKGKEKFIKKPMTFLAFLVSLRERSKSKPIFGYNPDGLKKDEIKRLQELDRARKLEFKEISIAKTLPFAPVLIFGALLTYFLKGSLIEFFI